MLFDGVCNLCNRMVDFVIRRDPAGRFRFASLQSSIGSDLAAAHGIDASELSSMVLIEDGEAYTQSTAALRVYRKLRGPVRWLWLFRMVPESMRNVLYRFIAKRRYRWFGQRKTCRLPTAEEAARFL